MTPGYLNQLIQNNGGVVSQEIINDITSRQPGRTLAQILVHRRWMFELLVPEHQQGRIPYIVGINLGHLPVGAH
jgi:hypothetical protein